MTNAYYANTAWGTEPIKGKATGFRFVTLTPPVTRKFGGQWSMVGAYGQRNSSSTHIAMCPSHEDEKARLEPGELWTPSHRIPGPDRQQSNPCTCGIYTQTLQEAADNGHFSNGTLIKVNSGGFVRGSRIGSRMGAAKIKKIWTTENLDNEQLQQIQDDFGVPIRTINIGSHSGNGINTYDTWREFITKDPEMKKELEDDNARIDISEARQAGSCPSCNSANTQLDRKANDSYGYACRDGICKDCGHQWDRDYTQWEE